MKVSGEKRTKPGRSVGGMAVNGIVIGGMAAALMIAGGTPAQAAGPGGREPVPMMYVGDVRVNEGEFDSAVAKIPITLSAPLSVDTYFTVQTVDDAKGGAQPGQDYKAKNVRKRIRAGVTSATISVPILSDTKPEAFERVPVRLTAVGAPVAIVKDVGTVTIVDDDAGAGSGTEAPTVLSASATSVFEGDAVKRGVPVTVRLSRAQASDVTVSWKAVGDSAGPGTDFKPMTRTTVIKAGRVNKTVRLPMYGDTAIEADEQMRVVVTSFAGASGMTISTDPLSGMVFMVDDDADSDDDGLPDVAERYTKTDPHRRDTDGDQIVDGDEIRLLSTNPLQADTDSDGFDDLVELKAGTDPLDPADWPTVDQA